MLAQIVLRYSISHRPGENGPNGTLTLTSPPGDTFAPPGMYMLFVLSEGTPSHAQYVRVSHGCTRKDGGWETWQLARQLPCALKSLTAELAKCMAMSRCFNMINHCNSNIMASWMNVNIAGKASANAGCSDCSQGTLLSFWVQHKMSFDS